ncbi:synaptic vesicle glycoprotein 2B [Apis cerana cerana]|uniref:Synaptic vesicle glycoprotein 2B n=1 Tax=Apis cerana cerana TaxID=94128 RepID=A0A2A3E529_APICC|nr:synaptic vesicle glycoprotein 2B [Apis cerana cerana]
MLDRRMSVPAKDYLNCPDFDSICLTWKINAVIYQNSAIIALSAVTFSFLVGNITTSKFRRKAIMRKALIFSLITSFVIHALITGNIVTALNIDIIPIPLRSTSLSMLVTVGNVAAVLGNFIFSALLEVECLIGFMGIGCLLFACFCLSFFHPRPVRPLDH